MLYTEPFDDHDDDDEHENDIIIHMAVGKDAGQCCRTTADHIMICFIDGNELWS